MTLTLTDTPTVGLNAEQENYQLECTITNETTGEAIELAANIDLDDTLIVDTDQKVIKQASDGQRLYSALTVDSVRRDWLKLIPGDNTLNFVESNTGGMNIDVMFDRRYFE